MSAGRKKTDKNSPKSGTKIRSTESIAGLTNSNQNATDLPTTSENYKVHASPGQNNKGRVPNTQMTNVSTPSQNSARSLATPSSRSLRPPINSGLSTPSKGSENSSKTAELKFDEKTIAYSWRDLQVYAHPEKPFCKTACDLIKCKCKKDEDKVYGDARPGELLAIMGSSGSGKSTLLDCLNFRTGKKLRVTGYRNVNGKPVSPSDIASISAYVQQDDLFIGTLTVKEHLIFQAMVRMDKEISYAKRLERVEEVIVEFQLTKCQKTTIGIPGKDKGISGGERRRLSFASEVLTNPLIMFCDEPTSGLDAFMAKNLVAVLKHMASKGKTIICTIHQPSSDVYATFSRILLMAEGKLAFLGTPQEAQTFFKSVGADCPVNHNPADFFIQLLAVIPNKENECRQLISQICDSFRSSSFGTKLKVEIEAKTQGTARTDKSSSTSPYKASWCAQFRAVLWRSWLSVIKDYRVIRVQMFQTISVALLIGSAYFGQELDQDGVFNINGALFICLSNIVFQCIFSVIHGFCLEIPIFMREHLNGMYRTDVYFISKSLAEIPVYIVIAVLFSSIVYYMIGLNPLTSRLLGFMSIMISLAFVSTSFGYFISCLSSNIAIALAIASPAIIPFMLFGGFFLNIGSQPTYLKWFGYISWFKYGNEALLINQWKGINAISCTRQNATCPPNGAIILQTYNFDEDYLYMDYMYLLIIFFVIRVMAFIALLTRSYLTK